MNLDDIAHRVIGRLLGATAEERLVKAFLAYEGEYLGKPELDKRLNQACVELGWIDRNGNERPDIHILIADAVERAEGIPHERR